MSGCQVSQLNKKLMLEPVRYRNKRTKYDAGVLRHLIEMKDAGLPKHSYLWFLSICKCALHLFGGFMSFLTSISFKSFGLSCY